MARQRKEEWKIFGNVFDEFTIRSIQKLMSQTIIEGVESPVQIGKEANIFTATTKNLEKRIIKIYRLDSCNFNTMYRYIKSDPRFIGIKKQRRQVIFTWVKREYKNLIKARQAGLRVPTPFTFLNHILILEMIGTKEPAPQLKDQQPADMQKFLDEIIKNVNDLYKKAGLVHADLSEYNILNSNDKPIFIDFSQSTDIKDSSAKDYLKRDLENLKRYFKKFSIQLDTEKAFNEITENQ